MPLLGEPQGVPSGAISIWTGSISTIPAAWVLCDGTNGTPDLRTRFPKCVPNAGTNPGATGGVETVTLTETQLPSHRHSFFVPNHQHDGQTKAQAPSGPTETLALTGSTFSGEFLANISTTFLIAGMLPAGGGQPHNNLPAFTEVLYIMKV